MSDVHDLTMPPGLHEAGDFMKQSVDKLGQYVVTEDIAEGTFGKVKMAIHVLTGQRVAMKYLSKEAITATRTKMRVQREVDYMRVLNHPHIVKLYEVISTPKDIIIVLEYAGEELFNFIVEHGKTHGRLAEPQARRFFQQLINGINYSHRQNIVHRDLKPENVLLDDQHNVKIADFGLSSSVTDGQFLTTSCGSPNYAAPEVILGDRYTGPEVDVWSCGVILYVMLCGRLPFEDDDVATLFQRIIKGSYFEPPFLSQDAKTLLASMLCVHQLKRITIPDVMRSNFYLTDLPRYLTPPPPPPGPVLGTLSSLVSSSKTIKFEYIEGLGRIEDEIVQDLADRMGDVALEDVWDALRMDDGPQGNAVKVAYTLLRDKQRTGRDLAEYEEQERDALLAAMDPSNTLSPFVITPNGADITAPFETSFVPDDIEGDEDDGIALAAQPRESHFAVLHSSLPYTPPPETHSTHKRSPGREKKHKPRWHFGIRSRSPPMEVMLEIYRTLQVLGMEWKEKKHLGGLGGLRTNTEKYKIERRKDSDGEKPLGPPVTDDKAASSIYYVEARARIDDIVVLVDLQLYQVDDVNYLVDFKHQGYYKASNDIGAKKFDRAATPPPSSASDSSSNFSTEREHRHREVEEQDNTVSPYLFMDTAYRLILELAGGGEAYAAAEPMQPPT